ncbi:MAG TPA: hypothetical protein VJ719_08805 [Chthoniobacterales bacterium]|nr:hypothetical protein [Chthoniobacterales bacterium]
MRTAFAFLVYAVSIATINAQDAAQPAMTIAPAPPAESPPVPEPPSPTPIVPELETLDKAFNQTGLGRAADELRARVEMRKLQNQVAHEPNVMSAKAAADTAATDLDKRDRLREYYELSYGLMSKQASGPGVKALIDKTKKEHLAQLAQPRVRPRPGDATPTPTPKKKKAKGAGKRF